MAPTDAPESDRLEFMGSVSEFLSPNTAIAPAPDAHHFAVPEPHGEAAR
jgi:hypothetical protein